jgi:transposase
MRGLQNIQPVLFSYIDMEERIPADHPIRGIRKITDKVLKKLNRMFNILYSPIGRPSIPPEYLIKGSLIQILYGIRSEIQLMEQMSYNFLFRWFVGLGLDEKVWTPEVYSMNRDRLFNTDVTKEIFRAIIAEADGLGLLSDDHFTADGTLIKAWASQKSFRRKDEDPNNPGNGEDFRGEKRSNATHESKTDTDARLYKKSEGSASELCFIGHVLMENRNGLVIDNEVTVAETKKERDAALEMMKRNKSPKKRVTLGGDKGYDVNDFHTECRENKITPHIAQRDDGRETVLDGRTTRQPGYLISIQKRKLVEQVFGWVKSAGCIRQVKIRGIPNVGALFELALCMYNLVRMQNLAKEPA